LKAIQQSVPSTVVQYVSRPYLVDGIEDHSTYILEVYFGLSSLTFMVSTITSL